jgi:hypothetical protein
MSLSPARRHRQHKKLCFINYDDVRFADPPDASGGILACKIPKKDEN